MTFEKGDISILIFVILILIKIQLHVLEVKYYYQRFVLRLNLGSKLYLYEARRGTLNKYAPQLYINHYIYNTLISNMVYLFNPSV